MGQREVHAVAENVGPPSHAQSHESVAPEHQTPGQGGQIPAVLGGQLAPDLVPQQHLAAFGQKADGGQRLADPRGDLEQVITGSQNREAELNLVR